MRLNGRVSMTTEGMERGWDRMDGLMTKKIQGGGGKSEAAEVGPASSRGGDKPGLIAANSCGALRIWFTVYLQSLPLPLTLRWSSIDVHLA